MSTTAIQEHCNSMDTWAVLKEQATTLVRSGFLPNAVNTPEKAIAIIIAGKELGIPAMQAIRGINVIQGTPTIKPELMLALCIQRVPGFSYEFAETTTTTATVIVSRPGMAKPFVSTFTMEDARRAGLVKSGGGYEKNPANMLRWRALANALHVACPDVLVGIYTHEEMGADVNEAGEIIQPERPEQPEPVTCDDCYGPITDKVIQGKSMSADEIIRNTNARFNATLCLECAGKRYQAEQAAKAAKPENIDYDPWDGPNDENPNNPIKANGTQRAA